jgi:hypothetical protein
VACLLDDGAKRGAVLIKKLSLEVRLGSDYSVSGFEYT